MKHLIVCAALVLATSVTGSAQSTAPSEAARVGDRVITLHEVDEAWKAADAGKFAEAIQALYDGRKETIDRMVAGILIEQAAAAKKTTVEKLLGEELAKRRKPVSPAEVEAFYAKNQAQMQGEPLDKMRDVIARFLEGQRDTEARNAYVAELKKAGPAVRVSLDPPRMSVAIAANDPIRGAKNAAVTIVEFSDFQCPFCARVTPTIAKLRETYGDSIRIVWKDFPLTNIHPQAAKAAEAGHCAADQGKYWEFHDRLFANQSRLQPDALKEHAAAAGLEPKAFAACLDSGRHAGRVQQGVQEGQRLGVSSTPTFFINGRVVTGAHPYETFSAVIDDELARGKK
jgi:protein-disulfide isomerase